ncbi:MAG: protein kinase [Archangiaceae bacterium]|nr:protein kinase [Archangiaceae bacterium]
MPPVVDPLIGQRLGDFVVEEPVAAGGMGVVYRAKHPLIGRRAAVKVLKPEYAADREQSDRFLKEAQALSAIKHRGIIEIIGFGNTPDGRQYMTTEFLDGESLESVIHREAPMPALRVLALVDEVLQALSAAHKSQVVHRDLKPSNVFLSAQSTGERVVKLLDFGLAKQNPVTLAEISEGPLANAALAKASLVAGTPEYIAPEQARGLAPTPRTDLYCLGVMMFEMLSGALPFKADSVVAMMKKHVYEAPPALSGRVSNLPDGLYDLVTQLLEKDPEKRPASADSARQVVNRLTRQLQADATVQRPNPLPRVVPAPFRTLDSEAPTPPIEVKGLATEPVLRTPTVDKLETDLRRGQARRPMFVALALGLLALVVWWLWPRGQVEPVAPPKVVEGVPEVKAPEPAPAVLPAPVPADAVEKVEADDPLPNLPVSKEQREKPRPKVTIATARPNNDSVEISSSDNCASLGAWRQQEADRLDEIKTKARGQLLRGGMSNEEIDLELRTLGSIRARIDTTANGNQCRETTRALTAWAEKHGL